MKAKTAIPEVKLESLLEAIKSRVEKLREVESQANHLRTRLYVDCYLWIEGMLAKQKVRNLGEACTFLGHTVKNANRTIYGWYHAGRFMRDHKMDPDSVHGHSVWRAANAQRWCPTADMFKIVQAIKDGIHPGKVGRMILKARKKSGHESVLRARRSKREGSWTKANLKMELMVVHSLCKEFFKTEGQLAFCSEDGEILLEVSS